MQVLYKHVSGGGWSEGNAYFAYVAWGVQRQNAYIAYVKNQNSYSCENGFFKSVKYHLTNKTKKISHIHP